MCRFTTPQEYKARDYQAKTWCLCKGQRDATWECIRFWLENKLLPRTIEEASLHSESARLRFQTQFVPFNDRKSSAKDAICWYAVTATEFERCKRDLKQCVVLYADVNVNSLCDAGETILYTFSPYVNDPPNLEYYLRNHQPPPLVKSYVALQELRSAGLSEGQRLQCIMDATYHKYIDVPDYLMLAQNPNKITKYAHPSDFRSGSYKGLCTNEGDVFEFFPVLKREDYVCKVPPTGIPRSKLQVVATEAEADFVKWEMPPPGSQEQPRQVFLRLIK